MVLGINPRRGLDIEYLRFLELASSHISNTLASAEAYEEERARAEALAQLDKAKTIFFGNVSHELRTPLTLILGPLEDEIRESKEPRERIELAHRNGLRLLKLVNTLLDFSRIEAGKMETCFEATDLAAYTAELAGVFRAGIERAGLRLLVNCAPLPEPAYLDRNMWEKIVFNLLSNALKFTAAGEIEVKLVAQPDHWASLIVRDTGSGIPATDLPTIFERFRRARNQWARSHEGTGIGLALVQELTRLHGGEVTVESAEGHGTTFTVSVPLGLAHLAQEPIGVARPLLSPGASLYVDEALRWSPDSPEFPLDVPKPRENARELAVLGQDKGDGAEPPARILLADDNPDMRGYVERILSARGYDVVTVADGQSALESARAQVPALVLSDVMMPRLDGFNLLRELRNDPATRSIPIVLLSARAGEEARIEGIEAGADDYLIKPFSARELLARIATHLELARVRRESHEKLAAAQSQLADKAKQLESLVRERTFKLTETIGELEAFSYSIAHDMRAPLRSMQGFSHILLSEYEGKLDDEGMGFLKRIAASADRMDKLIRDVLNYSRVVRADAPLEEVDVEELVQGIVETYPGLGGEQAEIRVKGPLPAVLGNEAMLMQIFSNLLGNAVKFVRPGVKPQVEVWAEPKGELVRFFVKDNGLGIAPDQHKKIFEIFQQVEKTADSTGIGLAIVRKAIERMGGKVGVQSELGRGSTFWFEVSLPGEAQG